MAMTPALSIMGSRGVSYGVSDKVDIIGKAFYLRAKDLDFDGLKDVEVPAISARLGVRFTF